MNELNNNTVYGLPVNRDGSFIMKAEVELYPVYKTTDIRTPCLKRIENGGLLLTVITHPLKNENCTDFGHLPNEEFDLVGYPIKSEDHGHGHSVLLLKEQALKLVELLQRHIANIKG